MDSDSHPSLSWHLWDRSHTEQDLGSLQGWGSLAELFVGQGLGPAGHVPGWSQRPREAGEDSAAQERLRQWWVLRARVVLLSADLGSPLHESPESCQTGL